jgi:alkanesulfonate monooxygenase
VADALQESFERDEFDGFTILPPIAPSGLDAFVDLVVPELRRRGVFRSRYEGTTLRDHLALDRPRRATNT